MKISELIEELKKFDLNSTISFVGNIEHGRSLTWIEVDDCIIDEEDGNVYLKVSGDVDEDGGCE